MISGGTLQKRKKQHGPHESLDAGAPIRRHARDKHILLPCCTKLLITSTDN